MAGPVVPDLVGLNPTQPQLSLTPSSHTHTNPIDLFSLATTTPLWRRRLSSLRLSPAISDAAVSRRSSATFSSTEPLPTPHRFDLEHNAMANPSLAVWRGCRRCSATPSPSGPLQLQRDGVLDRLD
jgi:hypothetical protein